VALPNNIDPPTTLSFHVQQLVCAVAPLVTCCNLIDHLDELTLDIFNMFNGITGCGNNLSHSCIGNDLSLENNIALQS
jgi:hypothetical protein